LVSFYRKLFTFMRILILNWRDIKHEWAGGSEVYLFEIAKRWVKKGHTVTLFAGQDIREKLPDEELIDGIKVIRRGGRYSLYFWAFIYYIKRFRYDTDVIVDVQNGIPFFSVLYSRKPKTAIVYHVHGKQFFLELPFPVNFIGFVIERYLFPIFYSKMMVIAISQTTREGLMRLGFKNRNINIVYCGIDSKRLKVVPKKFSHPTILYLGRIKRYKRVDKLVKMMPEILEKVKNANLLIAGWGTEASTVMDISMRSMNRRRVKIIGPVSEAEKRNLLAKSWVFVNPSIGEGWGISIIEANLYGTPAVSFKVAGLSESIKNGETGFLVGNDREFVEKVSEILKDKKLRLSLSRRSLAWSKKFNWDKAATEALLVLEKARKKR
jgi:glycosyltransferase involved in cell wall biosynthesis